MLADSSQMEEQAAKDGSLQTISLYFAKECLKRGWPALTWSYFCQIPWPASHTTTFDRKEFWSKLSTELGWIVAGKRHKAKESLIPRVRMSCNIDALFETAGEKSERPPHADGGTFIETYDVQNFTQEFASSPTRKFNAELLNDVLGTYLQFKFPKRKGVQTQNYEKDAIIARASKLKAREILISQLDELLSDTSAKTGAKRRRILSKRLSNDTDSSFRKFEVTYIYKRDWRSRRYISGPLGSQAFTRSLQTQLLPHTVDLDIKNCLFTIAAQILDKLQVVDAGHWDEEIATIKTLAEDRDRAIKEHLRIDTPTGKILLLTVFGGSNLEDTMSDNLFLKNVSKAGKFFRWCAVSAMPDVFAVLNTEGGKDFPEASCCNYLTQGVEDFILNAWLKQIKQKQTNHLSLHFDGVRVDRERVGKEDAVDGLTAMINNGQAHIKAETGFSVMLAEKVHTTIACSLMGLRATTAASPTLTDDSVLLKGGNCILLSICLSPDDIA